MGSEAEYRTPNDWNLESEDVWDLGRALYIAKSYRDASDWGIDHLGLLYVSLLESEPQPEPLRIGRGETVAKAFVQARARMRFFWSLNQLRPKSTDDLVS